MEFEELVGREFDFYGAAEHQFRLDDTTWEAIEDEDDGYRSYLGSIEIPKATTMLFGQPIARVRVTVDKTDQHNLYRLMDIDGRHTWLTFGTENTDDYYPWFTFLYEPKSTNSKARGFRVRDPEAPRQQDGTRRK